MLQMKREFQIWCQNLNRTIFDPPFGPKTVKNWILPVLDRLCIGPGVGVESIRSRSRNSPTTPPLSWLQLCSSSLLHGWRVVVLLRKQLNWPIFLRILQLHKCPSAYAVEKQNSGPAVRPGPTLGPTGLFAEPELRVLGLCPARRERLQCMMYWLPGFVRCLKDTGWTLDFVSQPDFLRCRSGLGLGFWSLFLSLLHRVSQ